MTTAAKLHALRTWIAGYQPEFMRNCPIPHQQTVHADAAFRVNQFREAVLRQMDLLDIVEPRVPAGWEDPREEGHGQEGNE